MKRGLIFLLICIFFSTMAGAQLGETDKLKKSLETTNKDTVAWVHGGIINIGLNEGFLHNWAAGGELASMTINGLFSGYITHLYHRDVWSNNLDLNYSLFYAYSNHFTPRKVDDRIDFTSKYGHKLDTAKDFYLTGLFNMKSQFTKGFDYGAENWDTFSTSRFLSPAYFTLALGLEYRKGTDLSLFLSPVAARMILADKYYTSRSPEGAFGVPYNKTSQVQLGAYFSGRYQINITKNMLFKTRLDLYSNYLAKDRKDSLGIVVKKDNPGNIDILSDNLFSFKISKFVNVAVGATFMYDNDIPYVDYTINEIGARIPKDEPGSSLGWWQVKQILTFGFEYRF